MTIDLSTFDANDANRSSVSGLACRQGGVWIVRVATTETAASGPYRQAGSTPAVMNMVDTLIEGDPLTDAQERAERDKSWR